MRVVYLDPEAHDAPRPPLRTGEAGLLSAAGDDQLESEVRLRLSPNSVHALLGHGVVDRLNRLPLEGTIGEGVPAVIPPAALEGARGVFYDADRNTYGGSWEFVVGQGDGPVAVEYRLRIDNREYQVTLVRLADLATQASRHGHAVWIQI